MTREGYVAAARARAELLYLGEQVAHRSCGIALAETFGVPSRSYQALRKGGLTGEGACGALQAGVLVLGELLGDPEPTGGPTAALKEGVVKYRAAVANQVSGPVDASCNTRTAPFPEFGGRPRLLACTALAVTAAGEVAGVLWDLGRAVSIPEAPSR